MSILNVGQCSLQAFKLSHSIGFSDKLLYQSQVLPPFWTLLVLYPLKQLKSFLVAIETGFPHLKGRMRKLHRLGFDVVESQ